MTIITFRRAPADNIQPQQYTMIAAALSRVVRPTVNLASRGAFAGRTMPAPVRAKYFSRSMAAAASASANPVAVFDTSMGSFEVSPTGGGPYLTIGIELSQPYPPLVICELPFIRASIRMNR